VSRYCLDRVTYSHFKRGAPRITGILNAAEWIGVPVIVIGELCAGFAQGSKFEKKMTELNEFVAQPVVETLPVDRSVARLFGEIVADLRRSGWPIPSNDIWIAATCARAGATLLTWNSHFRYVPRIGTILLEN
jgi:tRNA(fMet)-specific endonuclease VapC